MGDDSNTIRIVLTVDGSQYTAGMKQAVVDTAKIGETAKQATVDLGAGAKAVSQVGGVAASAAREGEAAMGLFANTTARAKTELLVLAHELAQGRTKQFGASLMVLGEQLGVMEHLLTPVALGIGGIVAAAGLLAYGMSKGSHELLQFNNDMTLTGHFAGITAGQLRGMGDELATTVNGRIGSARELLQQLTASGQFTYESLGAVAKAVETISRLSGRSEEEVLKQFAHMGDGAAEFAYKLNQSYHFLTVAQYEHIKALEDQGKQQQAVALTMGLLTDRAEQQFHAIGFLPWAWHQVGDGISYAWDAIKHIGAGDTLEEQVQKQERAIQRLEQMKSRGISTVHENGFGPAKGIDEAIAQERLKLSLLERQTKAAQDSEKAQSDAAVKNQALIEQEKEKDKLAASEAEHTKTAILASRQRQAELEVEIRTGHVLTDGEKQLLDLKIKGIPIENTTLQTELRRQAALESRKLIQDQITKDRQAELKDEAEAEIREHKKLRDAQVKVDLAEAEHEAGRRLTEAEREQVELESRAKPLRFFSLDAALKEAAAYERQNQLLQNQRHIRDQINQALRDSATAHLLGIKNLEDLERAMHPLHAAAIQLGDELHSAFSRAGDDIASMTSHMIVFGEKGQISGKQIAQVFLEDVLQGLIKVGLQMALNYATGLIFGKAAEAATLTEAGAAAAAWAPAAAFVSLASFGANALPATAGIVSTVAASEALAIGSSALAGGREYGGPVSAGSLYPVGERGKPELLQSDGKYYLIPGDRGGSVTPARAAGAGGDGAVIMNVSVSVMATNGPTRASAQLDGDTMNLALAVNATQLALQKDLQQSGPVSQLMQQTFSLQRAGH